MLTYQEHFTLSINSIQHQNITSPILEILSPSSNQILIIHVPLQQQKNSHCKYPYTLLQIQSQSKIKIVQSGYFPCLLQQSKLLNKDILVALAGFNFKQFKKDTSLKQLPNEFQFIDTQNQQKLKSTQINSLVFFNFRQNKLQGHISYSLSQIYNQRCQYTLYFSHKNQINYETTYPLVIFYKSSQFKSINQNRNMLDYEISVYSIHKTTQQENFKFIRIKKYREQFQNHHQIVFFQNQIVAIEISGYSIQIYFLQSKLRVVINSIYSLLLIDYKLKENLLESSIKKKKNQQSKVLINKPHIELYFSHDQLEDQQLLVYGIQSTGIITKIGKNKRKIIPNVTQMSFQKRLLQYCTVFQQESKIKRCINQKQGKQNIKIGIKVNLEQKTKYLFVLDKIIKEDNPEFKQLVMQLLYQ